MIRLLLCIFICLVSIIAGSSAINLTDEIIYDRFHSTANSNYSVRFVNPRLCDPNVTQVCEIPILTAHYIIN